MELPATYEYLPAQRHYRLPVLLFCIHILALLLGSDDFLADQLAQ
jgi:hypothetical protein